MYVIKPSAISQKREVCMPRSVALRFKILRLVDPAWMVMGRMAGNTGGLSFTSLKMILIKDRL